MNLKSKLPDIGTTIFSTMSALANKHDAINLSQGFPNFKIDQKLKDLVLEALSKDEVQYAPMPGRLDLRQEISKKITLQHAIQIDPDTEITITAGATQAIYSIITTLIQEGDEVILFDPAYDCYDPSIRLHGGISIHLKLQHPKYNIDWNGLRSNITEKTKLIILNNPHNPCGVVWTENDLSELEKVCQENPEIFLLSDEVYEHIQFSGIHQSVLKNNFLRERSFVTYSFGKTFHVTGWKLGYCIAPNQMMKEFRKVHQFNVFCVNNSMQYAVAKYLKTTKEWQNVAPLYKGKREIFLEKMKESRFKALNCEGTYFCLFDYSEISDEADVDFAKRLTEEYGVAAIPISIFYEDKTDHKVLRFCFAKEDNTILQAAELLCKI